MLDLELDDWYKKNSKLLLIENILKANGRILKNIDGMPTPEGNYTAHFGNSLIADQLNYNQVELVQEAEKLLSFMTSEQRDIFNKIMNLVSNNEPSLYFVYGYGGTSKTYLWRSFTSTL